MPHLRDYTCIRIPLPTLGGISALMLAGLLAIPGGAMAHSEGGESSILFPERDDLKSAVEAEQYDREDIAKLKIKVAEERKQLQKKGATTSEALEKLQEELTSRINVWQYKRNLWILRMQDDARRNRGKLEEEIKRSRSYWQELVRKAKARQQQ